MISLPDEVKEVFWNLNPNKLQLDRDRDLIFVTVLSRGRKAALQWLFLIYGAPAIRDFVVRDASSSCLLPASDRSLWLRVLAPDYRDLPPALSNDWGLTRQIPV